MELTLIVSTGRCGSTMLTRILDAHRDVLSVNEFFTSLAFAGDKAFADGQLGGADFWTVLSDPAPVIDAIARSGVPMPELLYPYGRGRFSPATGVPAICHTTLPALMADPDVLYDELASIIPSWPRQAASAHYEQLFAYLARRFGRQVVVERSGASLAFLPRLRAMFPDARFVHVYRSGPACALSMSRHVGFRVLLLRAQAARLIGLASPFELLPEHAALLPADLAHLAGAVDGDLVMRTPIPLSSFGHLWSQMIEHGVTELSQLPPQNWIALSYECITSNPRRYLPKLAQFAGFPPTLEWLQDSSSYIRQRAEQVPADAETLSACAPGNRALERQAELQGAELDRACCRPLAAAREKTRMRNLRGLSMAATATDASRERGSSLQAAMMAASASTVSVVANSLPIHLRAPAPKGMKA